MDDAGGSRAARGGARLPVGMRAGRGARGGLRARRHGARREARAPAPRRLRAGPLPGRAAASLLAARPGPQPLARAARRAARRPHRRHRQRPRARPLALPPPGRAGRDRAERDARVVRAAPPRQLDLGARLARRDGRALRRAPGRRRRDRPPRRAPHLRPHRRPRLPLPRLRGRERRRRARPRLRPHARRALRRQPAPRRGRSAARPGAGDIRGLGLSGFFLLHRDMLELARDVAVEVRGPDSARSVLPPGRGRGSSVSSIVCYLTGLSHVDPVKADLFSGRFLNDETDIDARHRPRLPPRHPRGADPARGRALRPRALGAGRRLPDLPAEGRGARPRQGARAAAGGDRQGREDGRLPRGGRGDPARPRRGARRPRAPPSRAGRCCCGSPRRSWASPATRPSTRAGW